MAETKEGYLLGRCYWCNAEIYKDIQLYLEKPICGRCSNKKEMIDEQFKRRINNDKIQSR